MLVLLLSIIILLCQNQPHKCHTYHHHLLLFTYLILSIIIGDEGAPKRHWNAWNLDGKYSSLLLIDYHIE